MLSMSFTPPFLRWQMMITLFGCYHGAHQPILLIHTAIINMHINTCTDTTPQQLLLCHALYPNKIAFQYSVTLYYFTKMNVAFTCKKNRWIIYTVLRE